MPGVLNDNNMQLQIMFIKKRTINRKFGLTRGSYCLKCVANKTEFSQQILNKNPHNNIIIRIRKFKMAVPNIMSEIENC